MTTTTTTPPEEQEPVVTYLISRFGQERTDTIIQRIGALVRLQAEVEEAQQPQTTSALAGQGPGH